ncbi:MAG: hypothetical protein LBF65_02205 [Holosporales bacterium]|jgi:hypothetical protein|nr:hypothetical protein [Holosporales bacterium]
MIYKPIAIVAIVFLGVSCGMLPDVHVWLKQVDFEVDPKANKSEAFECHIVAAYSKDLWDRLQSMDAQGYFTSADSLQKTYKDSIEVFSFDIIPGRNKLGQKINLKSYNKAQGAMIFAKYSTPGKFAENVGSSRSMVVRFLPHKMEIVADTDFGTMTKKLGVGK